MIYTFGPYRLAAAQRSLERDGKPCEIGSRAMDILNLLVENAGQIISKDAIVARAWPSSFVEESSIRVQIAALRKALDDADRERYVRNVAGRGYCFVAPVERHDVKRVVEPLLARAAAEISPKVPPPLTRMIGREAAVSELINEVLQRRLVSVVASGGIGKTTVAVAAANALVEEFQAQVFFVDLAALKDGKDLTATIASALEVSTSAPNVHASIIESLQQRRILLVLDNCEHIIQDAAALIESLFLSLPALHIIATSREALRIEGENVLHLPPLEAPPMGDALSTADIERYPAVQLFYDRAAAAGFRSIPNGQDAANAARICQRLDGIPLALELAAGRAGAHGIAGVVQLLENRFRLHWRGRRAALPRHQTLRAMFDWSYNLLTEQERTLFRALSVFTGGFTPEMAAKAAPFLDVSEEQIFELCEALAEKSLVSLQTDGHFYRLTETARAYAGEALQQNSGEWAQSNDGHADYFLTETSRLTASTPLFGRWGGRERTADLLSNVRSALRWSLGDRGDVASGIELVANSWPLFYEMGLLSECADWASRGLSMGESLHAGAEASLCEAIAITGTMAVNSIQQVKTSYARCLALSREVSDQTRELRTLAAYNVFITRIGGYGEGLEVARKFEMISGTLSSPIANSISNWMSGTMLAYVGSFGEALSYLEKSVPRYPITDLAFTAMLHLVRARSMYARTLWIRGTPERALSEVELALVEARSYGNPVCLAIGLAHGAGVSLWCGHLEHAHTLVTELRKVTAASGLASFEALAIGLAGEIALRFGDVTEAEALLNEGLARADAEMHANTATSIAAAQAECAFLGGRRTESVLLIDRAIERALGGESFQLAELYRLKGTFLMDTDRARALEAILRGISVAEQQGATSFTQRARASLSAVSGDIPA